MVQTINKARLQGVLPNNSGYVVENVIRFRSGRYIDPGCGAKVNESASGRTVDLKIGRGKERIGRQKARR